MISAYQTRQAELTNLFMWQAWHIAAFSRSKKLPSIKNILRKLETKSRDKPAQSKEQMFEIAKLITKRLGGKIIKRGEEQ